MYEKISESTEWYQDKIACLLPKTQDIYKNLEKGIDLIDVKKFA